MHVYSQCDLTWDGGRLRLRDRVVASIEPDHDLWRVHLPDGRLSDVVNLTRARDAAVTLALGVLNRGRREAA